MTSIQTRQLLSASLSLFQEVASKKRILIGFILEDKDASERLHNIRTYLLKEQLINSEYHSEFVTDLHTALESLNDIDAISFLDIVESIMEPVRMYIKLLDDIAAIIKNSLISDHIKIINISNLLI